MGGDKYSKKTNNLSKLEEIVLKFVPDFFRFLGWLSLLGVYYYVSNKTGDTIMEIILIVAIGILSVYINISIVSKFFIGKKTSVFLTILQLVMVLFIGLGLWWFLSFIVSKLATQFN